MIHFLFLLFSWLPFHHHQPHHPPTPVKVIIYEIAIAEQLQVAEAQYPQLEPSYFTNVEHDLVQLQEPVDSPTFEKDFEQLQTDVNSLRIAIHVEESNHTA